MRRKVILITFSLQLPLHTNAVLLPWLFGKEKVEGKGRKPSRTKCQGSYKSLSVDVKHHIFCGELDWPTKCF